MVRDDDPPRQNLGELGSDGFAAVVREHWTSVYRLVYCSLGDAHDAEDLAQETFLRAWNRRDTFQPGTCMRVWLLRIAANAVCDLARRRKRLTFITLEHDPADEQSPARHLELAEAGAILRIALEQLSEMTRMVFHLRVQEDLSFRDIAELVGTTEQGARWHMHQARTKLAKSLSDKPSA